jgi:hypothetical protein
LLKWLIVLAVVAAQGPAFAAAICRHQDMMAHMLARQSVDAGIAAEALSEEQAADAVAKKGQLADAVRASLVDMLAPSPAQFAPVLPTERLRHLPADAPELAGRALSPPLQPPTA